MHFSRPRMMLTLAVASIGLLTVTAPALGHEAGDGNGHRGKVGRHVFVDSEQRPGARCIYQRLDPTSDKAVAAIVAELVGVIVRPPRVAAINRTDHIDHQRVAWRLILQEKVGEGDWTNVRRSSLQIRRTTDHRRARLHRMAVRYDGNPEADYRVVTKAFWLKPRLRRMGMAFHTVEYYRIAGEISKGSCPGGIPAPDAP